MATAARPSLSASSKTPADHVFQVDDRAARPAGSECAQLATDLQEHALLLSRTEGLPSMLNCGSRLSCVHSSGTPGDLTDGAQNLCRMRTSVTGNAATATFG